MQRPNGNKVVYVRMYQMYYTTEWCKVRLAGLGADQSYEIRQAAYTAEWPLARCVWRKGNEA